MERLTDLRFIIGLFFTVVGILLVITAFAVATNTALGKELNLYAGLAMLVFGVVMLGTSWRK